MLYKIESPVYFERILENFQQPLCIKTTQKRLALQDALSNHDLERTITSGKEYSQILSELIQHLQINRNVQLTSQPMFDWNLEKESYMSPCWKWDLLMTNSVIASAYEFIAVKHMEQTAWVDATKNIKESQKYINIIVNKILPSWSWKLNEPISQTQQQFWKAKYSWNEALLHLNTLNYGIGQNISEANQIKLLSRIEWWAQDAVALWGKENKTYYPSELMNWARCGRAYTTGTKWWREEKYGESLGLLTKWKNSFEHIEKTNISKITLTHYEEHILETYDTYTSKNENIFFNEVDKNITLPEIKSIS